MEITKDNLYLMLDNLKLDNDDYHALTKSKIISLLNEFQTNMEFKEKEHIFIKHLIDYNFSNVEEDKIKHKREANACKKQIKKLIQDKKVHTDVLSDINDKLKINKESIIDTIQNLDDILTSLRNGDI